MGDDVKRRNADMSANGTKYENSEADLDAATRRRRRRRHIYKRRHAVRGRPVSRDITIESTRVRTSSSLGRERGTECECVANGRLRLTVFAIASG